MCCSSVDQVIAAKAPILDFLLHHVQHLQARIFLTLSGCCSPTLCVAAVVPALVLEVQPLSLSRICMGRAGLINASFLHVRTFAPHTPSE
jgi:hypothetical protein